MMVVSDALVVVLILAPVLVVNIVIVLFVVLLVVVVPLADTAVVADIEVEVEDGIVDLRVQGLYLYYTILTYTYGYMECVVIKPRQSQLIMMLFTSINTRKKDSFGFDLTAQVVPT